MTDFEIERSTSGVGGTFTLFATVAADVVSLSDNSVSASTEYCYRIRAINTGGQSSYEGPHCATTPSGVALQDGLNGYDGTRDTYIYDVSPGTARGFETTFTQDVNTGDDRRSLLLFDLTSIPQGSTILSASLKFYIDAEGQGFDMYRMKVSWDEATVSIATIGNRHFEADDIDAESSIDALWPGNDSYTGFDSVSIPAATIQDWLDSVVVNNGWLMIGSHASDGQQNKSR